MEESSLQIFVKLYAYEIFDSCLAWTDSLDRDVWFEITNGLVLEIWCHDQSVPKNEKFL